MKIEFDNWMVKSQIVILLLKGKKVTETNVRTLLREAGYKYVGNI